MEQRSIVNILQGVNENSNLDGTNIVQEIKKAFTSAIEDKKINKTEREAIETAYQNWGKDSCKIDHFFKFKFYYSRESRTMTDEQTLLHFAARCACQNVVNALIQAGANVNAQKVNVFKDIFAKDVDYEGKFKEITDALMRKKVAFYEYNRNKETSLYFHSEEDYQNAVKALKDEKLDIVRVCSIYRGDTSLHFAAKNGRIDVVNALIQAGAKVDALGGLCKNTPLHLAAENGHIEVVYALIQAEAKVDALDGMYKDTPLHLAVKNGHTAIVQLLLKEGADINAQNECGETPLYLAAKNGHISVVEFLLHKGAKVDTLGGEYKSTPLHFAAENGHERMVEFLLNKGATVDAQNTRGETPLHFAALRGDTNIIQSLIYRGADVTLKEARGLTPLDYENGVAAALLKKAEKKAKEPIKCALIVGIAGGVVCGLSIGAMLLNDSPEAAVAFATVVSCVVLAAACGVMLYMCLKSDTKKGPVIVVTHEDKKGDPNTSMNKPRPHQGTSEEKEKSVGNGSAAPQREMVI